MDRNALSCRCTCQGRGQYAPCDPEFPNGCGHLDRDQTGPLCPGAGRACKRPVADGLLCSDCTQRTLTQLADVPWLAAELEVTRAKLDRIGDRCARAGAGGVIPLGYRPAATEVADVLYGTLADCARRITTPRAPRPPANLTGLAAWLTSQREMIRRDHHIAREITYAVHEARRTIDRPADRTYARPGASSVRCRALYLAEQRRRWLLESLREHLAAAAEIAQGIGHLYGEPINRKRINLWHHRDALLDHGTTRDGRHPLFKIGDVLDLAERAARRHTEDRRMLAQRSSA